MLKSTTMADHGWGDGEEFEFGEGNDGDESGEDAESADGTDEEGETEPGEAPDPDSLLMLTIML